MGIRGTVSISPRSIYRDPSGAEPPLVLNINVDNPGGLIGRRGQTLACLQYLVRLIITHKTGSWLPVVVDIEGYKQRRYQSLQVLARNIAEQVKVRKSPFALEPMPAYERRIIHLTLINHPDVTTQSIGIGDLRKVIVLPKED